MEKTDRNSLNFEIKKYLNENIGDVSTCKNIMSVVNKKDLKLERVKKVYEYIKKTDKGLGYAVRMLENDWEVPRVKESVKIKSIEESLKTIKSFSEEKEETKKYAEKLSELENFYNLLTLEEKDDIDKETEKVALKEYGVMAKFMIKIVRGKILEEYKNKRIRTKV